MVDEEEGGLSDLDSSWRHGTARWKPRFRVLNWGFVAVGEATTAEGDRVIILVRGKCSQTIQLIKCRDIALKFKLGVFIVSHNAFSLFCVFFYFSQPV